MKYRLAIPFIVAGLAFLLFVECKNPVPYKDDPTYLVAEDGDEA
ncbi:hypothetical protein CASFOL_013252 [Castilleja foliolosa]|uniref:Uncharacterized protein n=1 Tax=Castilleja foliolosa TaxID=1961234 RepID=A0ABD3B9G5_9LAMI